MTQTPTHSALSIPTEGQNPTLGRYAEKKRSLGQESFRSVAQASLYEVPDHNTYNPTGIAAHLKQANSRHKDNFNFD